MAVLDVQGTVRQGLSQSPCPAAASTEAGLLRGATGVCK
jgi:hypothetical protein